MEIVPGDFISDHDKEIQRILRKYPDVRTFLIILTNRYRETLLACLKDMRENRVDTADRAISCAKTDVMMRRIDLPLLDTAQDWMEARKRE